MGAPFAALYQRGAWPRNCYRGVVGEINRRHKKRGLVSPLLETSSWLGAFDAGSPRIVFWTVRSPVAWSTLSDWRPRLA